MSLLPAEEKLFHTYMMESNVIMDEDVLRDDKIKRVDFLVMYYILRNKYEQAWMFITNTWQRFESCPVAILRLRWLY